MGWHREVTLDNIVAPAQPLPRRAGEHPALVAGLLPCLHLHDGAVAARRPDDDRWRAGCCSAAGSGGGGRCRRHRRRHPPVPDRPRRARRDLHRRAGPWLAKLREGFQAGRAELPPVPAPGARISVLVRQYRRRRSWACRSRPTLSPRSSVSSPPPSPSPRQVPASTASSWRRRPIMRNAWRARARRSASSASTRSSLVTKELVLALVLLGIVALIPVAFRRWRTHACSSQMTARRA